MGPRFFREHGRVRLAEKSRAPWGPRWEAYRTPRAPMLTVSNFLISNNLNNFLYLKKINLL